MITLKARDVALKALAEFKQLGAAHGHTECKYEYTDGTRCVIGLSMSDETIAAIKTPNRLSHQIESLLCCLIVSASPEDEPNLILLQRAHDRCCMAGSPTATEDDTLWSAVRPPIDSHSALRDFIERNKGEVVTLTSLAEFFGLAAAVL